MARPGATRERPPGSRAGGVYGVGSALTNSRKARPVVRDPDSVRFMTSTSSLAGETYAKVNPWRPSEITGEYAAATAADVDAAVTAADDAFASWAKLPLAARGGYLTAAAASLERRVDEIATDM